jgi:uncharacterized protein (TIGR03118 family)
MRRYSTSLTACFALALALASSQAHAQYQLTNLVSNQVKAANHDDPLLVNGWGLAYGTGPFWISDNGSGWSTLYDGHGAKISLVVLVPTAAGSYPGTPTGIVYNGSPTPTEFLVEGNPAHFVFATLDGTISAWSPVSNRNAAILVATSPGSVYTGLAITNNPSGNSLFAADNANNKIDMYDDTFTLQASFTDPNIPLGFSVFGIQDIGGLVYVSFANSSGGSGGFIDVFTEDGSLVKQLVQGRPLNQAWGFALAPTNFGPLSNTLLVSNNTDHGTINGFNPVTGSFVGTLRDTTGKAIVIDQLWGIEFGGGTANNGAKNELFFTAGPFKNAAGTFGAIRFQ